MIYKYTTWGIGEERGNKIQELRDVFFLYKIRGNRKAGVRERERDRASELASDMMKHAVRIVQSRILQRLRLGVQLDTDVNASVVVPATRWCSKRMYSEEAHASSTHLDRGNVVARVLNAVKTHQKVDPTKV